LQTSSAPDFVHVIPKLGCITKQINRARKIANGYPKVPSEVAELKEIPDMFRTTLSGEPFLIFNDWLDDEKTKLAMVFMSEGGQFILSNSTQWFMDETFSTTPKFFAQVVTNTSLILCFVNKT
jgi:hypothetical protein